MSAVAGVLNRAADLIERDGWVQRAYGNETTGYCIAGAIDAAAGFAGAGRFDDICWIARIVVEEVVHESWILYNDIPGRTQAEVMAALRAAAERAS